MGPGAVEPAGTGSIPAPPAVVRWWELVLIVLVATAVLFAAIVYYDDVHRATTNGLWKSIDVAQWVEMTPDRFTDGSNLLYYPAVGALVRVMPADVFGTVWQRMAFLNAVLGAVVLALTYAVALRLFRSRATALMACLAQLAMGFFLLLATINEDIMPGYLWFVAAVACAVLPRRLGVMAVVLTAQCVALAWLFHSSLQLPTVGAFVVGIAAWAGEVRRAAWRVALFVAALVPLPVLSAWLFEEVPWVASFWSGKGVGTGWGGFSANKVVFLWGGMSQAVAGGQNLQTLADVLGYPRVVWTGLMTVVLAGLFAALVREGWRRRALPEWRLAVAVLVAVFVLGEAMNLYVQPQDPQMQIQPMTWFPFAVACVYCGLLSWKGLGPASLRAGLVTALIALLAGNIRVYAENRHGDSRALANIRTMESLAPPARTLFLLHGFEGMSTWLVLSWGRGVEWPTAELDPARPVAGRFNAIYLTTELINFPDRSPADAADNIVRLVDRAMADGFEVVATDIWAKTEEGWVDSYATVAGPDRPRAIRAALHERYVGRPIGTVPSWTDLYRLGLKPADQPNP